MRCHKNQTPQKPNAPHMVSGLEFGSTSCIVMTLKTTPEAQINSLLAKPHVWRRVVIFLMKQHAEENALFVERLHTLQASCLGHTHCPDLQALYTWFIPFTAPRALNLSSEVQRALIMDYNAKRLTITSFKRALHTVKYALYTNLVEFKV